MSKLIAAARRLHATGSKPLARLFVRCLLVFNPRHYEAMRLLCAWAIESKDYGTAEMMCRKMLQIMPDDPGTLSSLGHLLLLRGAVKEAAGYFRRHGELTAGPETITTVFHKQHLDLDLAKSRQRYFKQLADVLVDTAYWTIMKGDVIYSDDTHGKNLHNSPLVGGRITPDGETVIATFAPPRKTIDTECIFVGGDDNYSHWVFRNLLKLSTLDHAGLLGTHPWLVNSDLRRHQREYLDLFRITPDNLVQVDRNDVIRCRKLVVPALLTNSVTICQGVEWIRSKLGQHMVAAGGADRLIYVSRRDSPRRVLLNEDQLLLELSALGFELVVPGELSVVEQIRAFSSARLIVGAHGAALANLIFAPRHAAIVEITSTAIGRMDDFRRTARIMGQSMVTIMSDQYPKSAEPPLLLSMHSDYFIDIDAVLEAVRKFRG